MTALLPLSIYYIFKDIIVDMICNRALAASLVRTATTNVIWRKGLGNFTSKSNRKSLRAVGSGR